MQDDTTTKRCPKCGDTKKVEEFSSNRSARDGLQWNCKLCTTSASKEWRSANHEEALLRDKKRRDDSREHLQYYRKSWYSKHKEEVIERSSNRYLARKTEINAYQRIRQKQWKSENPELYLLLKRTHERVRYALKTGRLTKPDTCEECGQTRKITAAHYDYSRPLDVRWLCHPCHAVWDHADPKLKKYVYLPLRNRRFRRDPKDAADQ